MWKRWPMAFALILPLLASDMTRQKLTAQETSRFTVAAAGSIRLEKASGEVDIDAWDRPEVEVTVVRSSEKYYGPQARAAGQARLDSVKVASSQEGNDVVITTTYPPLNGLLHPFSRRSDVEIHYMIHAPRDSRLVVDQTRGGLDVAGLRGDIQAEVLNGQITLSLPDQPYSIEAHTGMGDVYSDFEGQDRRRQLIGREFQRPNASAAVRLYLHVRNGDIMLRKAETPPVE